METPKTIRDLLRRYLMPYQAAWLADGSRYKIGMWSRQTGKSFATACEAVVDCVFLRPGQHWVVLSAGERQALEWMRKARFWVEAFQKAIDLLATKSTKDAKGAKGLEAGFPEYRFKELVNAADARLSKGEVEFANGSRITAIPANPDTARGYSCNVILDEFAIHEDPEEIWAAVFPSVTSPHGGLKKLRIVSTPKGRGNKFAGLWEHNESYSCHKVTIEDAVRMGLKVDIEELKAGIDDPDIWAQEYMCEFIDNTSVLLPYEMIGKCESGQIADDGQSPLYVGMDVGRSRDLSVIVTAVRLGDVLAVVDVTELRNSPFNDQLDVLLSKAGVSGNSGLSGLSGDSARVKRVCIDATGIGAMLAEEAARRGGARFEGVAFTAQTKGEMYGLMRRRFEERSVRIPVSRELREDLHAVQRLVSAGGNVTYAAPRSADGHSDRAAALALCIRASEAAGGYVPPVVSGARAGYESRRID